MRSAATLLFVLGLCLLQQARAQCIDTFEPGCKLAIEEGHVQRHCVDPTKYWYCPTLGGQAVLQRCPANTGFDQNRNVCIPWIDWVWEPCIEPPSRPTGVKPCGN
ncbi:uncharacterized protein LOC115621940 [Scaptodrosophila lebanonensis]|uniref:Uncharacterized protein LOC115621940 n=1 Tax=Drosophila lebanonensis TaxID=7225 RepID=A0A6J2T411_DROLE|nr:uncharacterized protein LOC115621940 [Scaptodrosophila lebanonensis]